MAFSIAEGFMSSTATPKGSGARPSPLRPTTFNKSDKSDEPDSQKPPKRASTFQNGTTAASRSVSSRTATPVMDLPQSPDAFETTDNEDGGELVRASVDMDELPIELISLTDT
jgi:hypothetical protein